MPGILSNSKLSKTRRNKFLIWMGPDFGVQTSTILFRSAGSDLSTNRLGGLSERGEEYGGHMADTRGQGLYKDPDKGRQRADTWRTCGGHMVDTWRTRFGRTAKAYRVFPLRDNPAVNCLGKNEMLQSSRTQLPKQRAEPTGCTAGGTTAAGTAGSEGVAGGSERAGAAKAPWSVKSLKPNKWPIRPSNFLSFAF